MDCFLFLRWSSWWVGNDSPMFSLVDSPVSRVHASYDSILLDLSQFPQFFFLKRCIARVCGESVLFFFCSQVRRGSSCRARDGPHSQRHLVGSRWFVVLARSRRSGRVISSGIPGDKVGGQQFQKRPSREFNGGGSAATAPRANPDVVKAAARSRIERLQSALDALGETESTEARGLQAALKGAERSAKERPLAVEVEECQFIKRSQNRLARLEEQRVSEQQELDAAIGRMAKFQEEMAKSIAVVPTAPGPTQSWSRRSSGWGHALQRWRWNGRRHGRNVPDHCQFLLQTSLEAPIWRCKHCTANMQDSTEGRSWRLSSAEGAL